MGRPESRWTSATGVSYSVIHRARPVLDASPISLTLEGGRTLGAAERVRSEARRQVRDSVRPLAPVKSAVVADRFNELRLRLGDHDLELRAYDEGVAYRWVLALGDSVTVRSEQASFVVAGQAEALVGIDTTFMTHYEPVYHRVKLDTLTAGRRALLPALLTLQGGPKIAITESQLEDYPGMYLVAREGGGGRGALSGGGARGAGAQRSRRRGDAARRLARAHVGPARTALAHRHDRRRGSSAPAQPDGLLARGAVAPD